MFGQASLAWLAYAQPERQPTELILAIRKAIRTLKEWGLPFHLVNVDCGQGFRLRGPGQHGQAGGESQIMGGHASQHGLFDLHERRVARDFTIKRRQARGPCFPNGVRSQGGPSAIRGTG